MRRCPIQKKNDLSVCIAKEGDTHYIAASELEQYMEAAHLIDVSAAINNIAKANNITVESVTVVLDEANVFTVESLDEAGIMTERAAEADSMSLKQAMKWYTKFVRRSRSMGKDASKAQLQERITVLKDCVQKMEAAKRAAMNGKKSDRIKYALKSLIPFNNIFRLIKKQDVYAGIGVLQTAITTGLNLLIFKDSIPRPSNHLEDYEDDWGEFEDDDDWDEFDDDVNHEMAKLPTKKQYKQSAGVIGANLASGVVMRYTAYIKMLDQQIKRTNEAIEFLEKMAKESEE